MGAPCQCTGCRQAEEIDFLRARVEAVARELLSMAGRVEVIERDARRNPMAAAEEWQAAAERWKRSAAQLEAFVMSIREIDRAWRAGSTSPGVLVAKLSRLLGQLDAIQGTDSKP